MIFRYTKSEFPALAAAEQTCWLMANGLGGYGSSTAAFSSAQSDQCLLVAAKSPSIRYNMVQRMQERLTVGSNAFWLSSQCFPGRRNPQEDGWRWLQSFVWENGPVWEYEAGGIQVKREYGMLHKTNTAAVVYHVLNRTSSPCTFTVTPCLQLQQKNPREETRVRARWDGKRVLGGPLPLYLSSSAPLEPIPLKKATLHFRDDAKDGRQPTGIEYRLIQTSITVPAGQTGFLEVAFSTEPLAQTGLAIVRSSGSRQRQLLELSRFRDPVAQELSRSADVFIADRYNTRSKTIVAGYPFFGDWGRDTMISLPGCVLSLHRYEDARSILHTFLAYEQDGLVPNLFPEGSEEPAYNSADAPLLLIQSVWLYYQETRDQAFIQEAWPVLQHIIGAYCSGTHFAISMDRDGLIQAGTDLDQVTWMDVRIDGILPTPRHGKPVEINAYWYNALCIMRELAPLCGADPTPYCELADKVKDSFVKAFWIPERGYLRDVINGTYEEEQIRCNQIWAVSIQFPLLSRQQELSVVQTVKDHLWTPNGLRTLSPIDPAFHPIYGGLQKERDLAYHQGTVWPFPMGAFYRAYLKVHDNSPEAVRQVRTWLQPMDGILREGCVGQIAEIYDGAIPGPSRGCFAQAWSVGEILRVYAVLEELEAQQQPHLYTDDFRSHEHEPAFGKQQPQQQQQQQHQQQQQQTEPAVSRPQDEVPA